METLEQLKTISDNAPEGATHIDDVDTYWKVVSEFDYYFYDGLHWDDSEPLENGARSLSDIERIIELEEKLKSFADDIGDCNCIGDVSKNLME